MKDLVLFFDGCHKIYYATKDDNETIAEMEKYGYEVIGGKFGNNLRELWQNSCSLRFVQTAKVIHGDEVENVPEVNQFQKGGLRGFISKLRAYYND